ncbi:unnamed protein product [Sphagnum jensenii]|uniref:Uncharacterized protein n=1 Tax=Sphagnum jensenii TaxID=128206 RepID=A0ABP1ATJ9_9BRYO
MKVLHDIRWPEMLYETEEDAGASVEAVDDEMKPSIQPLRILHKSVLHQQQQGANNQGANVHDLESPPQLLFPPQRLPSAHATKSPLSHNWSSPNVFKDNSGSSSARGFFDTRSSTNLYTRVPAWCPHNTGSDRYPSVEMHNLAPEESNNPHSWSMQGQNDNIELSNDQQQRVMKPSRFVRHAHSKKTAAAQNKKHNAIHGQNQTQSMSANPSYNSVQATTSRGSHMPALFLRCSGSHDEKAIGGTGVFLPHYYIGNGSKHKQKPVCLTVLLPYWIVEMLNFEERQKQHSYQHFGCCAPILISQNYRTVLTSANPHIQILLHT